MSIGVEPPHSKAGVLVGRAEAVLIPVGIGAVHLECGASAPLSRFNWVGRQLRKVGA